MKVAELESALLDCWVAKTEGEVLAPAHPAPDPNSGTYWLKMGQFASVKPCPQYHRRWDDAGPIIERGLISLLFLPADSPDRTQDRWEAFTNSEGPSFESASPLVAAMRAYVASKFGEEVPDIEKPL